MASLDEEGAPNAAPHARPPRPDEDALLKIIAGYVRKGQCILFLGAAVHSSPPDTPRYARAYSARKRPPLGSQFSKALAAKSDFLRALPNESPKDLRRVALHYESTFFRKQLIDEIRKAVHNGKRPSPILHTLARLDFPLIITTNYDQLLERAYETTSKQYSVSVYSSEKSRKTLDCGQELDPDRPFILKVHGDVMRPESIVITDEDYIQFVMRMGDKPPYNPVPPNVRRYLAMWPTLFIGYSLLDYNFRLLFNTLRWKVDPAARPQAYSVDLYPDPLIYDVYHSQRRLINFLVEDVWNFVPKLHRAVKAAGEEE